MGVKSHHLKDQWNAPPEMSFFRDDLEALSARGRLRSLTPRCGHDFSSNDYLGLASSDRLRNALKAALENGVSVGSGGSRLLRGNDPEHEALESEAAAVFGSEATLFFSSGFQANFALLSTLPQRGDLIVYDELIHASVHDGLKATRGDAVKVAHNDPNAVEDAIKQWRASGGKGKPWLTFESLYSMDGNTAPIADYASIARAHDGYLLIDEAHATGIFGSGQRGLAADLEGEDNVITLHTCGKALGLEGALACLPKVYKDFLINRGRPFIFSTAPSPLMASGVREALRILQDEPERAQTLRSHIKLSQELLGRIGLSSTDTQIQPIIVGDDTAAMDLAKALQAMGFDIRAVRPPTVPAGTARLRMTLTLNVSEQTIRDLVDALSSELPKVLK